MRTNTLIVANKPAEIQVPATETPMTAADHRGLHDNFAWLTGGWGDVNSHYMVHANPKTSLKVNICATCGADQAILKDRLNSCDINTAIEASEIASGCPECVKALGLEG